MNKQEVKELLDRLDEAREFMSGAEYQHMKETIDDTCEFLNRFNSLAELVKHIKEMEKRVYVIKEYLTVDEVARYLQVSKATVYRIKSNKEVTYFKPNGKTIFIRRAELENWIGRNAYLSNSELERQANLLSYQLEKDRSIPEYKKGGFR